jgi:nitric oxide reductase subunit C
MRVGHRKLLLASLVLAFTGQTALVYTDDTAERYVTLDALALRGRALWHQHNCQTCHQIHGFGGFLGPDLTNAAPRLTRTRLDEVLTRGSLQMPAFGLPPGDIDAIEAWLEALDRSGVGQARRFAPLDAADIRAAIREHVRENPLTDDATRGFASFEARCNGCHTLFRHNPLGVYTAPDLAAVTKRLADADIDQVLVHGRPSLGMPPSGLDQRQRAEVVAFLHWLGEHEPALRNQFAVGRIDHGVPWFEYR